MPSNSASAIVAHLNLEMPASSIRSVASLLLFVLICGRKRDGSSIIFFSSRIFSFTLSGYTTRAGESNFDTSSILYHSVFSRSIVLKEFGSKKIKKDKHIDKLFSNTFIHAFQHPIFLTSTTFVNPNNHPDGGQRTSDF